MISICVQFTFTFLFNVITLHICFLFHFFSDEPTMFFKVYFLFMYIVFCFYYIDIKLHPYNLILRIQRTYNGLPLHSHVGKTLLAHKLEKRRQLSLLSAHMLRTFAFFNQPAIQLLQQWWSVVTLWAVMDANEDPTVNFHRSEDLWLPQEPWCGTWYNPSSSWASPLTTT